MSQTGWTPVEQPTETTPTGWTPVEEGQKAPPKKYFPGREFGFEVAKGMGLDAEKIRAAEDYGGRDEALKEMGSQVLEGLTGFVGSVAKDPFNIVQPIHGMASALEKGVKERSPGQIVGAMANILGGTEATKRAIAVPGEARAAIGAMAHDPVTGRMYPGATRVGRAAGMVTGGAIGGGLGAAFGAGLGPEAGAIGLGYAGLRAGEALGPSMMEKIFPEPASRVAARKEFLQTKTITEAQEAAMKANAKINSAKAKTASAAAPASKLSDLAEEQRIVSPDSPPPPINRTLVSYSAEELLPEARRGNIDYINELIRNPRGLNLKEALPNMKFLFEGGRPTRIYGGPGSTK